MHHGGALKKESVPSFVYVLVLYMSIQQVLSNFQALRISYDKRKNQLCLLHISYTKNNVDCVLY